MTIKGSEKLSHQPGDICFPGGAVEEGESPEAAFIREMTEELLIFEEQRSVNNDENSHYDVNRGNYCGT